MGFHDSEVEPEVRDQLTKYFAPEFLNRIDFIGVFNNLSNETARQILETRIVPLLKERWERKNVLLEITPAALMLLVEKGYSKEWGARNLERTVDEFISSHLIKLFSNANEKKKIKMRVEAKDGSFRYKQI